MHPSVIKQAIRTPAADEWVRDHPERFVPLLPFEEEVRETWAYEKGHTPQRIDTMQAQRELKSERAAVKGLLAMAQRALRSATQTEVIRDEGGRSVYEDSWVSKFFEELIGKRD